MVAQTHKIAIRTKGLEPEQAARLFHVVACAVSAFADEYETASNISLGLLNTMFPDSGYHPAKRQDRLDLVT